MSDEESEKEPYEVSLTLSTMDSIEAESLEEALEEAERVFLGGRERGEVCCVRVEEDGREMETWL